MAAAKTIDGSDSGRFDLLNAAGHWLDTRRPSLSEAQELAIVWLSKPLGARRTADAPNPRTMRWLVDHGFAAPVYEACGRCSACASRGVCRHGRNIVRLTAMGHQVADHG